MVVVVGEGGVSSASYLAAGVFINVTFLFRPPLLAFRNEGAAQKGVHVLQSFPFLGALTRDSANIAAPGPTMHFANRHTHTHALTHACMACRHKGSASALANAVNNSGGLSEQRAS